MATQITSYARNGVSDWLVQRVTAYILAVYTVVVVAYLFMQPEVTFVGWKAFMSQTWMQVFTLMALLSTCAHAWIGMWTVGTDYLREHLMGKRGNVLRTIYLIGCVLVTIIYLVWGVQILWG
jgi:succinate dehydrogenase / fumarate reductase membrane anchor subunit